MRRAFKSAASTTIAGAVLIVVEDRDVELLPQRTLDLEAARRGDVLQVDVSEGGRRGLDDRHDLLDLPGVEAQREGVDSGELLEEHRLPSMTGIAAWGADVTQAEDGGAVRDDGDPCCP
jgi:hypothetical protein